MLERTKLMAFNACIPIILSSEGGYVDNPHDPGGPTNLGITLNTLSGWLGRPASIDDVKALTPDIAGQIYQANYYNPVHGPDLQDGVDLMAFDASVNSGPGRAIMLLQTALGVKADGLFGRMTLAAAKAKDPSDTINAFHDAHAAFYRCLSTFPVFGKGWLARNDRTCRLALAMISSDAASPTG
jgi:lysozyme family protein